MVFLSEDGDPIMPLVGITNQTIELYLKMIKQGDYQIFQNQKTLKITRKLCHVLEGNYSFRFY